MENEDVSVGDEVEKCERFTAEIYAAESLAADMDPWITFDARKTPRAEFESWLETNKPSQVSRYGDEDGGRGPVGWICVRGPDYYDSSGDVDSLLESWDCLLESGRPVNFQTVKELALNHGVLEGKWLIHLESGFKVDHAWECIARATLGIYRNNRWKLSPTIFESKFDLECVPRRSHVVNKVTNLEVT